MGAYPLDAAATTPLLLALLLALPAYAERSSAVKMEFQRLHPCPSTGLRRGACPNFRKDHVWPICAGGSDSVENMQWQEYRESLRKDAWERKLCRDMKKGK
jgi:hypothetical protein